MKALLSISAIASIVLFTSCKRGDNDAKQISQLNTSDTFRLEFSKRKAITDSALFKSIREYENEVGLMTLRNGFDSIQIRISYGGAMVGDRLVILMNKDNKWVAEISNIKTVKNPNFEDSINVDFLSQFSLVRTSEFRMPKSGWKKFISKLFDLGILTLPDHTEIVDIDYGAATDGVGVGVEIATKNVYRRYGYDDPDFYIDKYWQMRNISQILKLVDEEFGLKNLWDYTLEMPEEPPKPVIIQEMKIKDVDSM